MCTCVARCVCIWRPVGWLCVRVDCGASFCRCVCVHNSVCSLWPAMSQKWIPFYDGPNNSYNLVEVELRLLARCHVSVRAQQKSGYFPAVPGLLMQRVLQRSAEILPPLPVRSSSIDLSPFCNGSRIAGKPFPRYCISLDSCLDK